MKILVTVILFFIFSAVFGQDGVQKTYLPGAISGTVFGNYYFKTGAFAYLGTNLRYQDGYYLGKSFPLNKLNSVDAQLGIQFQLSEKWSLGFNEKFANDVEEPSKLSYTGFNLMHQGKIKSIDFIKQVNLEYLNYPSKDHKDLGRGSFFAGLHKGIKVKERVLGFMFSYRFFKIRELGGDESSIYKKRFINRTNLRADVYFEALKSIYVGLFAMRDTRYFPLFDVGPNDKLNLITPTYGVTINFVINGAGKQNVLPGMPPL